MACSRDTDGDGDCGRVHCPECGGLVRVRQHMLRAPRRAVTHYRGVPIEQFSRDELLWLLDYLMEMNNNLQTGAA